MHLNVCFKSVFLPEYFTALQTLERLFAQVDLHVPFPPFESFKGFRTHRTPVRSLPCVFPHMNCQVALRYETLPAVFAHVWTLACVIPHVEPQLPGGEKSLPTLRTQEVLLSSVHPHVSHQVLDRSLPANVTRVAPVSSVYANV